MADVRVGLIGAGNISGTHARAVSELDGARIVAVYGPTLERAQKLADAYGAAASDTLERFFGSAPMDMVAIGTPSGLHGEHGAPAAQRGLHVLVEKPIEITTARADALIAEADRARVTLGVIFQDRLKPDVRQLKSLVDNGSLGRLILARAQVPWWRPPEYYRDSRWRGTWRLDGGGALMNQAIHTVDVLLWLCGSVTSLAARAATQLHDIEVEDTAVAMLEFTSGAIGTLEATTAAFPGRPRRIELTGTEGSAILEGDRLVAVDLRNGQRMASARDAAPQNVSSPIVSDASAHREVFADFIHAFTHGTRPSCDGREGRRSVQVIEKIYESSREGTAVTLKDDLQAPAHGG
jgi:UDP-N-acetyl-2-amino-2-deoxyglucuronate dehydrogenase